MNQPERNTALDLFALIGMFAVILWIAQAVT